MFNVCFQSSWSAAFFYESHHTAKTSSLARNSLLLSPPKNERPSCKMLIETQDDVLRKFPLGSSDQKVLQMHIKER